jgi:hypothetical protein
MIMYWHHRESCSVFVTTEKNDPRLKDLTELEQISKEEYEILDKMYDKADHDVLDG